MSERGFPMNDDKNSQSAFEQYIRQGEPAQAERAEYWQTAIGLQDDDGQPLAMCRKIVA